MEFVPRVGALFKKDERLYERKPRRKIDQEKSVDF